MRIERIQGNQERQILIAMIVDSIALGRIASKWQKEMFRSQWANVVGGWCVKFYNDYGKAPNSAVRGLFEVWAERTVDKDTISLVEKFLQSLDGEYAALAHESNSDFLVDLASKHFTRVRLEKLFEQGQADLDSGKVEEAEKRVSLFNKVELGAGAAIDLLHDEAALHAALDVDQAEDIVEYPGALGHFFRGQLTRDAFVAFLAPEKRGKTYWLIDIGWRAMLQRRRVAWFAAGDMSERQMIRRFATRAAAHPIKSKTWPCEILVPKAIRRIDGVIQVKRELLTFEAPLAFKKARQAFEEVSQFTIKSRSPYLKLATFPNSTLSAAMVDAQLTDWAREGYVADVVVIDYADIMDEAAALPGGQPRDCTNASWKKMRGISQKHHVLLVTATQSDADGGVVELLRRSNFSEDKRKLAHVTDMMGINQSSKEKKLGAFRLNHVVMREGEFSEDETVAVAACLGLGNPAVKSCF